MTIKQPSLTARGAAGHRAAHQILERGAIFSDPFARRILGAQDCALADQRASDRDTRPMRLFLAARSRFAEDALAAAVSRGLRQAVVLGAGSDTFALRNPYADLHVFEVDHPATQSWKRARLSEEGIAIPDKLIFVSVDFERENLSERLAACGFRLDRPAFFLWLGVVPYLTREAIFAVLRFIATQRDSEVAFDYSEPLENYPPDGRIRAEALAARVAKAGEPFLSHFEPAELRAALREMGFAEIEDLDAADIATRYFAGIEARGGGAHLLRARVAELTFVP
jgi:methyltransferase (TIGR00027 family)